MEYYPEFDYIEMNKDIIKYLKNKEEISLKQYNAKIIFVGKKIRDRFLIVSIDDNNLNIIYNIYIENGKIIGGNINKKNIFYITLTDCTVEYIINFLSIIFPIEDIKIPNTDFE